MLNLASVMIGTMQPEVLGAFYKEVFEKEADMHDGEGWYGWVVGKGFLTIGQHSEMGGAAKDPGRVMFNFETKDVRGEFARIAKIKGAKVIKEPYGLSATGEPSTAEDAMWISTVADPDGNFFQLMTPWEAK